MDDFTLFADDRTVLEDARAAIAPQAPTADGAPPPGGRKKRAPRPAAVAGVVPGAAFVRKLTERQRECYLSDKISGTFVAGATDVVGMTRFVSGWRRKFGKTSRKENRSKRQGSTAMLAGHRTSTAEPDEPAPVRGPAPEPERGAKPPRVVEPRPAAQHPNDASRGTDRIDRFARACHVGAKPIPTPLPDIAMHIMYPKWIGLLLPYGLHLIA